MQLVPIQNKYYIKQKIQYKVLEIEENIKRC